MNVHIIKFPAYLAVQIINFMAVVVVIDLRLYRKKNRSWGGEKEINMIANDLGY